MSLSFYLLAHVFIVTLLYFIIELNDLINNYVSWKSVLRDIFEKKPS